MLSDAPKPSQYEWSKLHTFYVFCHLFVKTWNLCNFHVVAQDTVPGQMYYYLNENTPNHLAQAGVLVAQQQ